MIEEIIRDFIKAEIEYGVNHQRSMPRDMKEACLRHILSEYVKPVSVP